MITPAVIRRIQEDILQDESFSFSRTSHPLAAIFHSIKIPSLPYFIEELIRIAPQNREQLDRFLELMQERVSSVCFKDFKGTSNNKDNFLKGFLSFLDSPEQVQIRNADRGPAKPIKLIFGSHLTERDHLWYIDKTRQVLHQVSNDTPVLHWIEDNETGTNLSNRDFASILKIVSEISISLKHNPIDWKTALSQPKLDSNIVSYLSDIYNVLKHPPLDRTRSETSLEYYNNIRSLNDERDFTFVRGEHYPLEVMIFNIKNSLSAQLIELQLQQGNLFEAGKTTAALFDHLEEIVRVRDRILSSEIARTAKRWPGIQQIVYRGQCHEKYLCRLLASEGIDYEIIRMDESLNGREECMRNMKERLRAGQRVPEEEFLAFGIRAALSMLSENIDPSEGVDTFFNELSKIEDSAILKATSTSFNCEHDTKDKSNALLQQFKKLVEMS
jgi:hypothetical protein